MKKAFVILCVFICVLLSVMAVTAYDQNGNDNWCNSDADGCWVTGEDGEKIYIMFWSDAAREKYMGKGSKATTCPPLPAGKASMPGAPSAPAGVVGSGSSSSGSKDYESACKNVCSSQTGESYTKCMDGCMEGCKKGEKDSCPI